LVYSLLFFDCDLHDRPATLLGEIIVASEVILGYTTLGVLLSALAQNIARRS